MAALVCLVAGTIHPANAVDTATAVNDPKAATKAFYDTLSKHEVSGLPRGDAWKSLKSQMTPKLIAKLQAAMAEQAAFMKKNPDEKPPWIEGDLFTSLFEGAHTHAEGSARISEHQAEVPVQFTYTEGGSTTKWTDTLILQKSAAGRWLVDDVRYGGGWPMASKGLLSEALDARE